MLNNQDIQFLIVHCSDTENNNIIDATYIHKMHLDFGWDGIGYHKIILRSGKIENGRPEYWVGAHVKGKNESSLGVCLIGRDKFTLNNLFHWKEYYKDGKNYTLRPKLLDIIILVTQLKHVQILT